MRTMMLAAAIAVAGAAGLARAQMYGHDLRAEWRYSSFGSVLESHVVTAGPGIELPWATIINDDKFDIDIGEDTVSFIFNSTTNWSSADFNGWYFEDVNNTLPEIIGYQILSHDPSVTPAVSAGWNENAFWADFQGTAISTSGTLTMQVLFVPGPGAAAVLGLGGLAAFRRRR